MTQAVKIKSALISVYYKDNLEPIIRKLSEFGVHLISTGGTYDFIFSLSRRAKIPPNTCGSSVFTLPPRMAGKPVIFSTFSQAIPNEEIKS